MSNLLYYERNLPHRLPFNSEIFLTFRLANSLPASVVATLQAQFAATEGENEAISYARQRRYFGQFDSLLNNGHRSGGPLWLREPAIAEIVGQSLRYFHGKAYILLGYCLMPNHVHLIVSLPEGAPPLAETLQRLKGYTALQANRLLGRTGQFWQREIYDHIVRDGEEMTHIMAYVVNNPVKAGLIASWEKWPYTYWPEEG